MPVELSQAQRFSNTYFCICDRNDVKDNNITSITLCHISFSSKKVSSKFKKIRFHRIFMSNRYNQFTKYI